MRPPPAAGWGPVYLPSWASELAFARLLKMSCAFCLLSGLPPQAYIGNNISYIEPMESPVMERSVWLPSTLASTSNW